MSKILPGCRSAPRFRFLFPFHRSIVLASGLTVSLSSFILGRSGDLPLCIGHGSDHQRHPRFSLELFEGESNKLKSIAWSNQSFCENGGSKPLLMKPTTDTVLPMIGRIARGLAQGCATQEHLTNAKETVGEH